MSEKLSERDRALIERALASTGHGLDGIRHIALAGQGYALDDEDWMVLLDAARQEGRNDYADELISRSNAARHQGQDEARAASEAVQSVSPAYQLDLRDERIAALEAIGRAMIDEYQRDDQCDYVRINCLVENIQATLDGDPLPYPAALQAKGAES